MPRAVAQDVRAAIGSPAGVGGFTLDTAGWTGFTGFGWFKNNSYGVGTNMLARSAGFTDRVLQIQAGNTLRFALACVGSNLSVFTAKSYPPGAWHHFVATYDGSNWAIYIDGVVDNSGAAANGALGAAQGTTWVISNTGNNATLSQFGIYNRGVTAAEAVQIFQGVRPSNGLQRFWRMDEGAGAVITDSSGNGGHGTVGSLTYTSDVPSKRRQSVGSNLLFNGDFEYAPPFTAATTSGTAYIDGTAAGSATNSLFGWATLNAASVGSFSARFDSTTYYRGANSLKLSTTAIGSVVQVAPTTSLSAANLKTYCIPVIPNASYTCTFRMKTNYVSGDSNAGAYLQFTERDAANGSGINTASTNVKTTTDWTLYTITFTTASTTRYVVPRAVVDGNNGAATLIMDAWFDDIVLTLTAPITGRVPTRDYKASLQLTGGYVDLGGGPGTAINATQAYTVIQWVKRGLILDTQSQNMIGNTLGDKFWFNFLSSTNQTLRSYHADLTPTSVATTVSLADNDWHRVGATFGAGSTKLYVDGIKVAEQSRTGTLALSTSNFYVGSSAGFQFKGRAADAVVYTRALTESEMVADFQGGSVSATGLYGRYLLGEGAGAAATDTSGNGNHGTIGAAVYAPETPTKKRQVAGGNLVSNGDFEYAPPFTAAFNSTSNKFNDGTAAGSATNSLFGWAQLSKSGSATWQFDASDKNSGLSSLKLSLTATASALTVSNHPSSTAANMAAYAIPVLPNTSYTLRYYMKTTYGSGDSSEGAFVAFQERAADGSGVLQTPGTKIKTTTGWTQYSVSVTTGSATRYVTIQPSIIGTSAAGTLIMDAWFDDITLTPTTPQSRTAVS